MRTFTPATDTAVTDHAACDGLTLGRPYISLRTHSSQERAPSSPLLLAVPEYSTEDIVHRPLTHYSIPTLCSTSQPHCSTPPQSPIKTRRTSSPMECDTRARSPRTYTPPSTPTKRSHSKSSSVSSSSIREELDKLRKGISPTTASTMEGTEKLSSSELRQFPLWQSDYEIDVDAAGVQKVIGQGAWSTVYAASPVSSMPSGFSAPPPSSMHTSSEMTPPLTPVQSRGPSISGSLSVPKLDPSQSPSYAIKVPYEKTAHRVLTEEGRILSYLSRFPSAEKYIVPYYGQDSRTAALVMGFIPSNLESLVLTDLNTREESDRAAMLADIFPHIACNLLDGLAWLQDKSCVHGDIKPANILINTNPSTRTPHAVYADFSASILPSTSNEKKPKAPIGGATWDFMAPSQLTASGANAPPTLESDLWALAMTILILINGASPYERVAPNQILKREILKQGTPLAYVSAGENGVRNVLRMGALSRALGFNVKKWLGKVLVRDEAARMSIGEWREELADALM